MSKQDDLTKEEIVKGLILTVFIVLGLYLFFGRTSYDCSETNKDDLKASVNRCYSFNENQKDLDLQKTKIELEIELSEKKLKHDHCENMAKLGKECKFQSSSKTEYMSAILIHSCDQQAKILLCKKEMFLWKLWYL